MIHSSNKEIAVNCILGIDQSLVESGVTIKKSTGDYCHFTITPKKLKGIERLYYIKRKFLTILQANQPAFIVMEGYSFASKGRGIFDLGELGGVLKITIYQERIPLYIVEPATLKKFVTGGGKAKKEEMLLKIYKRWGAEFDNNNLADSFALVKFFENVLTKGTHEQFREK